MGEKVMIGAIAKRTGMRPSAVRFYERQGLVTPERLPNGYRAYTGEAMAVLCFIHRAKGLGFSLEEVREILALHRQGAEPCACVAEMIERNVALIDQRIADLSGLRRQLRALKKAPAGKRHARAICPIIEGDA